MKIDELQILKQLLPTLQQSPSVITGPGDDCAVLALPGGKKELLVTADQLIEGVHFTPDTPPEEAGRKLMNRNVSDIAAMGGTPLWAVLTVAAGSHDGPWLLKFCEGVRAAGSVFSLPVVGGDLAALPTSGICTTLTLIGEVPAGEAVLRSTAKVGESLYVTGKIGNSFASRRHLTFAPRLAEGQYLRPIAGAMLDISDGLLLDSLRLAAASHVALEIDAARVPLHGDAHLPDALRDGEDYELLFTAASGLEKTWPQELVPVTEIGRVIAGNGELRDPAGTLWEGVFGYEH